MNFSNCTEKELWEYVAIHLAKAGLKNTLVGGAVVAIYSEGAYKSGDLDFVLNDYNIPKNKLNEEMKKIGLILLLAFLLPQKKTNKIE